MTCTAFYDTRLARDWLIAPIVAVSLVCLTGMWSSAASAQGTTSQEIAAGNTTVAGDTNTAQPIKRIRYDGNLLRIHLPTNAARALVLPEPVTLQGDPERLPGVKLAYEGTVVGFFATQNFTRRIVSFIGSNSGTKYNIQIRASENGIAEPLEIVQ